MTHAVNRDTTTRVWIVTDGKPGHLNQSRGLADALLRLRPDWQIDEIPTMSFMQATLMALLPRRGSLETKPVLVLAAGHRTHLTALALSRKTGARSVVIMKPSLPISWFDAALIPEHDDPGSRQNIILTKGALNRMQPAEKIADSGMVLIGGPSKHYGWDNELLIAQIKELLDGTSRHWLITTSRRTPAALLSSLQTLVSDRVELMPVEQTDADWLAQHLPVSEVCWVTPDSVSMIYEALTAGCRTGIFALPEPEDNRVVRGVQRLIEEKSVMTATNSPGDVTGEPPVLFDEANRCAQLLLTRFAL